MHLLCYDRFLSISCALLCCLHLDYFEQMRTKETRKQQFCFVPFYLTFFTFFAFFHLGNSGDLVTFVIVWKFYFVRENELELNKRSNIVIPSNQWMEFIWNMWNVNIIARYLVLVQISMRRHLVTKCAIQSYLMENPFFGI